jgi:hypothetical protein
VLVPMPNANESAATLVTTRLLERVRKARLRSTMGGGGRMAERRRVRTRNVWRRPVVCVTRIRHAADRYGRDRRGTPNARVRSLAHKMQ